VRKILARLLVFAAAMSMPLGVQGGQRQGRSADPVTVQLLAINDFHGNLEPPAG
jgi:2',3'-cyclic-nucleotide 2'-phosphodiesterase (5'-nucleotidase family)